MILIHNDVWTWCTMTLHAMHVGRRKCDINLRPNDDHHDRTHETVRCADQKIYPKWETLYLLCRQLCSPSHHRNILYCRFVVWPGSYLLPKNVCQNPCAAKCVFYDCAFRHRSRVQVLLAVDNLVNSIVSISWESRDMLCVASHLHLYW